MRPSREEQVAAPPISFMLSRMIRLTCPLYDSFLVRHVFRVFPTCDKFVGNRWDEVPQQKLRFPRWNKDVTKERLLELFAPYKEVLQQFPLYITLDKDVMRREFTLQNWNSGELSLDETLLIIETLIELSGGRLMAMDITGDFTKVHTHGVFRAYLHWSQHEHSENNIPQEVANTLNQRTNLKILRTVKAALLRARGQTPVKEDPLPGEDAGADAWDSSIAASSTGNASQ